jgi:glutamine cyclotransferase
MKIPFIATLSVIGIALFSCNNSSDNSLGSNEAAAVNNMPVNLSINVINAYPHDTGSFLEGLEWHDGVLYESSGNYGESKLAKVDLKTGKDLQRINLEKKYFGEGITLLNGKIYQLTYKEHKCFVYDAKTFTKIKEFDYEGEGWGMTNDGKHLIMDSGSDKLFYRDPETFKVTNIVSVTDNNGPLASINELEYVDGFIYSNVWETNKIVKIYPASGRVVAQTDLTNLINQNIPEMANTEAYNKGAFLNGIAYDSVGKRFFITGKLWPKLFEVKMN